MSPHVYDQHVLRFERLLPSFAPVPLTDVQLLVRRYVVLVQMLQWNVVVMVTKNLHNASSNPMVHGRATLSCSDCIVLYLYIYIVLLAVHTNQKRFQWERPREKRAVWFRLTWYLYFNRFFQTIILLMTYVIGLSCGCVSSGLLSLYNLSFNKTKFGLIFDLIFIDLTSIAPLL